MKYTFTSVFLALASSSLSAYVPGTVVSELNKRDLASDVAKFGYTYCAANLPDVSQYAPVANSDLIFVQAFMRHGDRAPVFINDADIPLWNLCDKTVYNNVARPIYVTDLSNSTLNFNYVTANTSTCLPGELTQKGAEYSMSLGKKARSIYVDTLKFLDSDYKSQSQLRVRSTYIDRTQETARYFLSGLYPITPANKNVSTTIFHYQAAAETLLTNTALCPKLATVQGQIIATPQFQTYLAADPNVTQKLNTMFDVYSPNVTFFTTSRVYQSDLLQTRVCQNLPLPCNKLGQCATASDVTLELNNIQFEVKYTRRDSQYSPQFQRFASGPLFAQVLQELNSAIASQKKCNRVRMSIYSGHDDTMSNIMAGLHADDFGMLWPSYDDNTLLELWKNKSTGKYSVRILNNGQILKVLGANQGDSTPWCDFNGCDFDTFTNYMNSIIPANLAAECTV
ncbi:Counting factor 60 [Smittium mucronatum]|uniref:Counting factor 60 n=1 Tax=Smittium mucronatum TaxID=133383 RepID=A0A1R0H0B4_9FUNG|nr:Counting factor 60 [Smittium mucronatum]